METTKADQRVQKQPSPSIHKNMQALIDSGFPIRKVVFNKPVIYIGSDKLAESALFAHGFSEGSKLGKLANLWWTPGGIVCEQKGVYKILPHSAVCDTIV